MSIFENSKKRTLQGPRGDFLGVIRRGPCEDLPTWTTFGGALAVTLATMGIMAKSMQRPRKVHFSSKKMDISVFQQGSGIFFKTSDFPTVTARIYTFDSLWFIAYADDLAVITLTADKLQTVLNKLTTELKNFDLVVRCLLSNCFNVRFFLRSSSSFFRRVLINRKLTTGN
jgi:hypothetical protein